MGVVLCGRPTGHVPFMLEPQAPGKLDIEAAHRLLDRILHEPVPSLECRDAPPGFSVMVAEKLLAKDRAKRYQTMKEVQGALAAFAAVSTTPIELVSPELKIEVAEDPAIAQLSDQTLSRQRLPD